MLEVIWQFMSKFETDERKRERVELLIWSFGPLRLSCLTWNHRSIWRIIFSASLWEIILLGDTLIVHFPSLHSHLEALNFREAVFYYFRFVCGSRKWETNTMILYFPEWALNAHMNSFRLRRHGSFNET